MSKESRGRYWVRQGVATLCLGFLGLFLISIILSVIYKDSSWDLGVGIGGTFFFVFGGINSALLQAKGCGK